MEKINKIFGFVLIIIGILSILANYYNVYPTIAVVVSMSFGGVLCIVSILQTYHYHHDHNPGLWWFVFSAIDALILVAAFYAYGLEMMSEKLAISIMTGLAPLMLPVIGTFIGDVGRIIIKSEPSAI